MTAPAQVKLPVNGVSPPAATARPEAPKRWLWIGGAALVVALLVVAFFLRPKPAPKVATVALVRQTLLASVTATGIVNPQDTISVGTQASGTILTLNADYNDKVRKGQVLARLDPTLLQSTLDQARANLAQAQAQAQAASANAEGANSTTVAAYANAAATAQNVGVSQAAEVSADANVVKSRAALSLAQRTLTRDRQLLSSGYIAQNQYDADYSSQVAADAAVSGAVVTAGQARMQASAARSQDTAGNAQGSASSSQATGFAKAAAADLAAVAAAQAQVQQATIDVDHTIITSPVDGTVIARNVSVGQTVAASFQTPTLFSIAKDLTKMEVDLAVGEPDVGSVRVGEAVNFTVLAYPNTTFHGKISQVRENPTTIANVVTYDTIVYVSNGDNSLRPGMTASAAIEVAQANDALVVPLAALTFKGTARAKSTPSGSASRAAATASAWGNTGASENATLAAGSMAQVTVVDKGAQRVVPVKILLVSGGSAAIEPVGESLAVGTRIAISAGTAQASRAPTPAAARARGGAGGLMHG